VISKSGKAYSLVSGNVYYQRLAENAKNRWFQNTYQKWIEVDGQMIEWRHRRYVWENLANQLYNSGITLAEFYKNFRF
jgi:predicted small secreted protein